MQRLTFTVPGPPVPKARARVTSRIDADGKRDTRSFTPAKTKAYENHVAVIAGAARSHLRQWPHLDAKARFGLSVSIFRSAERGDLDNFVKAISDACNGVLWVDDSQVRRILAMVDGCEKGRERVEVEIWTIDQKTGATSS